MDAHRLLPSYKTIDVTYKRKEGVVKFESEDWTCYQEGLPQDVDFTLGVKLRYAGDIMEIEVLKLDKVIEDH